jgi:hypothetical protein
MLALFAFGAFMAASASAVTFLLAEWLVGGATVTTELNDSITEELLLEDNKVPIIGSAAVLCSGSFDGWVGPNSLDWISEVLSLNGEAIATKLTGLSLDCVAQKGCETNTTVLVWPLGLPWTTEVELMVDGTETFFVDLIKSSVAGEKVGWEIENCLVLGSAMVDECSAETAVARLVLNGATLLGVFTKTFTELAENPLANCEKGGAGSGVTEGEGPFVLEGGGELSASSEGLEA